MARTVAMNLMELIVYKKDISKVLMYLGSLGNFQFQKEFSKNQVKKDSSESSKEASIFNRLQQARVLLDLNELENYTMKAGLPSSEDEKVAISLMDTAEKIHAKEIAALELKKKAFDTYNEATAFSNLNVSFASLEDFSFLSLKIGKVSEEKLEPLRLALEGKGIIAHPGNDKNRILVACSKKTATFVDAELKKVGFVELQLPKDFKGVPSEALCTLEEEKNKAESYANEVAQERKNYAESHKEELYRLLQLYSFSSQIESTCKKLESTEYVYRLTGWIPASLSREIMKKLDELTENRTGIRCFLPEEVSSIKSGAEEVPVLLKHGKFVSAFNRMILSYGSPLYGTIDPTPFVAIFFTLLFGIMFGDAGQGLVFLLVGILMCLGKMKLMGWEKFGRIFICIGITSTIMGLLTGEFFASEHVLAPFSRFVTGIFGQEREQILPMMPNGSPEATRRMFMFFGFTVGIGFIINTCGLIINIVNQFSLKRIPKALFGKTGLSGAIFFWYVLAFALSIAFLNHSPAIWDWCIIGVTLLLTAFAEPIERLMEGHRPVFENGLFSGIIAAVVEVIEVISSYISNTVSFLRVGAFALAHAVLGYIISMMTELLPGPAGLLVALLGNVIVIGLEGMIVAIQVVRLQYYEFFSKFFSETGKEFSPFVFVYRNSAVE